MYRCVVLIFLLIGLFLPFSYAEVSPQLEKVVQQLDWDMTRIGTEGRKARIRAIRKLTCLGYQGDQEQDRVLQTAGRLLAHENPLVVEGAKQLFKNLEAEEEIDYYRQNFRLRYGAPQNEGEIRKTLGDLLEGNYEGLEIIREFYPTRKDVINLNKLIALFYYQRDKKLQIRLRTFSLHQPDRNERYYISLINSKVIEDFHNGPRIPIDSICR